MTQRERIHKRAVRVVDAAWELCEVQKDFSTIVDEDAFAELVCALDAISDLPAIRNGSRKGTNPARKLKAWLKQC